MGVEYYLPLLLLHSCLPYSMIRGGMSGGVRVVRVGAMLLEHSRGRRGGGVGVKNVGKKIPGR